MTSLYQLTENYQNLLDLLGNPLIEEDEVNKALSQVEGAISDKAEAYAKVRQTLLIEAKGLEEEATRLTNMAKARTKNAGRLINDLAASMKQLDMSEIKTPIGKWKFAKNPPKVEIAPGAEIPDMYLKPKDPDIDKKAIKQAIEAGEEITGVRLVQDESLRFR